RPPTPSRAIRHLVTPLPIPARAPLQSPRRCGLLNSPRAVSDGKPGSTLARPPAGARRGAGGRGEDSMKRFALLALVTAGWALAFGGPAAAKNPVVVMKTSMGTIKIE